MREMELSTQMQQDIERMQPELIDLIKTLCAIPAPSHHEERRAAFVKAWLEQRGMHAEIDEALNVRCPVGLDTHEDMVVIMAHMDTVFPDMEPMPFHSERGRLCCPGVGDDTANLAGMMLLADYFHAQGYIPQTGVLFVANSCEEGLGNLKGCKSIMKAFGSRVKAFLSLDGDTTGVCSRAVGSARYRITVRTTGGHSFADFGSRSAVQVLSQLIGAFYSQSVPHRPCSITTFNVGVIAGGTSVNAIAQHAEMLYEYRSDNAECMVLMESRMRVLLKANTPPDAQVETQLLGMRPCGVRVNPTAQGQLEAACCGALRRYANTQPMLSAGSTDCNIPLSQGIPSACFGMYLGDGEHTREEWIDAASLRGGMMAALSVLLNWFQKA